MPVPGMMMSDSDSKSPAMILEELEFEPEEQKIIQTVTAPWPQADTVTVNLNVPRLGVGNLLPGPI